MKNIRLFWFSEVHLLKKSKENYGDLLGKYLVEKISASKVTFVNPRKFSIYNYFKPLYFTIGSILANVKGKAVVWGSGIITKDAKVNPATFLAVRGPHTRNRLLELGYKCPEVYGDPAILLPQFFNPKVTKKYKYGIIPHYVDFKQLKELIHNPEYKVIDLMTNDIEDVTIQILECEKIISTSLHGVIVPQAYGIPSIWIKFSDKIFGDNIKYKDYFDSMGIPFYNINITTNDFNDEFFEQCFNSNQALPSKELLELNTNNLLKVCPFK